MKIYAIVDLDYKPETNFVLIGKFCQSKLMQLSGTQKALSKLPAKQVIKISADVKQIGKLNKWLESNELLRLADNLSEKEIVQYLMMYFAPDKKVSDYSILDVPEEI